MCFEFRSMKLFWRYVSFVLIFFFTGCVGTGGNDISNFKGLVLNMSDVHKMDVLKTSEIIDTANVEFYELENQVGLIGTVNKLIVADSCFIIMDNRIGAVWIYSFNGDYLNKIQRNGKGPGEYVRMHTITYKSPDQIGVLDDTQKKVLWYHIFSGEFIKEDIIDYYACDICYVGDKQHIVFRYIEPSANLDDQYYYHVNEYASNKKYIRYFNYEQPGLTEGVDQEFFIGYDRAFYFKKVDENRLYKITNDGELEVAVDILFTEDSCRTFNLKLNKNSLSFQYQGLNDNSVRTVVCDIVNNRSFEFKSNLLDEFNLYYQHPVASDSTSFYSVIYPSSLWESALNKFSFAGDVEGLNPVIMRFGYR